MKRIKRPTKRVADTGQQGFGFGVGVIAEAAEQRPVADDRFKDDDPYHLFIGAQRLADYLTEAGMQWVVALRRVLARLDYSLLTVRYSSRGRQAFHPRTMLGLILYGLFMRHKALRDLESLSTLNVGAWWLCGGHRIDHSTLGKFVQLHSTAFSAEFFTAVAGWVVHELELRPGVCSIDGTVVEAAASHWKAIEAEAAQLAAAAARAPAQAAPHDEGRQAAAVDAAHVAAHAAARCANRQRHGQPTDSVVVVPSEPEAVVQPRKDGVMRPAYKPSTLMHEAGVILGQYVDPTSEPAAVPVVLAQHTAVLGALPPTVLLDAGYHHGPLLGALTTADIDVLCPSGKARGDDDWEKQGAQGRFAKTRFQYEERTDVYRCPAGATLRYADAGTDRHGRAYRRYRTRGCGGCILRAQCTTSARGRSIKRYAGDEYKEAMRLVLAQPRARAAYQRRMGMAEPVHAELRERLGLRRFHRRGLNAVRAEFALYCIAFNLKKVLGYVRPFIIRLIGALPRRLSRSWMHMGAFCIVHWIPASERSAQ